MGLIHMDSTLQRFWSSHSIHWMAPKGLLWGTIPNPQKTFYGPADQQNATERGHSFDSLTKIFRTSFLVPPRLELSVTLRLRSEISHIKSNSLQNHFQWTSAQAFNPMFANVHTIYVFDNA